MAAGTTSVQFESEKELHLQEYFGDEESKGEDAIIKDSGVDEGEKAQAVVQQLDLWDRLMEVRIQLQKVLSLVNRLPPPQASTPAPIMADAKDVLLQTNCTLSDVHTSPSSSKNKTIQFWHDKTRLASKKFKNFKSYQTPVVKQVEQILSDRDRLVRRTQVVRDTDSAEVGEASEEVFDDNDFYQRLLKNLIESKTSNDSLTSASASQWLEVQRLRGGKKKKDIDTQASKGRKLRYNVHQKLVNFMAARDDATWSTEARKQLFKNLFKKPVEQ